MPPSIEPRILFSCAAESFQWAKREVVATFGAAARVTRLASDLGALCGVPLVEVAAPCEDGRMHFIRHLTCELPATVSPPTPQALSAALVGWMQEQKIADTQIALQTWASDQPQLGFGPLDVFNTARNALEAAGYDVARSGQEHVLSCCMAGDRAWLGSNQSRLSLSDWPGGRVRLARHPDQISRAEFKLEELFKLRPAAARTGHALDLGASPGGWTRVLRGLGCSVCAVDPADLHHSLTQDRKVRHVRETAAVYLATAKEAFDLVVNDMRMDPRESCRIMLDVAALLRPNAGLVLTLKLGSDDPRAKIADCLAMLRSRYDICFARQLHHNRHELTVVGRLCDA